MTITATPIPHGAVIIAEPFKAMPPSCSTCLTQESVVEQVQRRMGKIKDHVLTKATHIPTTTCYRVNVFCRVGDGLVKTNEIRYSYFVTTNDRGRIIKSNPEITPCRHGGK